MKKITLIVVMALMPFWGAAQQKSSKAVTPAVEQPYEISCDRIEYETLENNKTSIKLIGNASLTLKEDKVTVTAEKIFFFPDERKMTAFNNVKIVKLDPKNPEGVPIIATAQQVEYFQKENKLILVGSPQLSQGKNKLTATQMVLIFQEKGYKLECQGNCAGIVYIEKPSPSQIE